MRLSGTQYHLRTRPTALLTGVVCLYLTMIVVTPPLLAEDPKARYTCQGHAEQVWSVAFNPDGTTLASASEDQTIKLWNVQTGKERATLEGHTKFVASVAYSPDGKTLASASNDKTIRLWEATNGQSLRTLQSHRDRVLSVAWSPDGKTLASASEDKTIPPRQWSSSR